ncbi:MAG: lipase family protein [Candidatus Cybelea sp.]
MSWQQRNMAMCFMLALVLISTRAAVAVPGDLVSADPIEAPAHAKAWRVVYETTGLNGRLRQVSGIVVVSQARAPSTGRAIVSWAHPTTGIAEACAPSRSRNRYTLIPGLSSMIARGYIVAATDYPGLGTLGPHPYLVGLSEARSVIDIVRASRRLPSADASNHYIAWGHSQGGQAVLFAGQIAASYAPELRLSGVVAVAPPTALKGNLHDVIAITSGRLLAAYTLASWSQIYDTPMDEVASTLARPIVRLVARQCALTRLTSSRVMLTAKLLPSNMLLPTFWSSKVWVAAALENSAEPHRISAPLLVVQGTNDRVVPPHLTTEFVRAACAAGARIELLRVDGGSHFWAGMDSASFASDWIAQRFASQAPNGCTTRDIPAPPHSSP